MPWAKRKCFSLLRVGIPATAKAKFILGVSLCLHFMDPC